MKSLWATRRIGCRALVGVLLLGLAWPHLRAATGDVNFTGHYELAGKNNDRSFSLDVTQTGTHVEISFSAGMADGSGAAPDGDGKGKIDASGGLAFTFKDSFDNEGTGTLVAAKDGYHLTLNTTKVADSRALVFYGDFVLRKTSNKVAPSSG